MAAGMEALAAEEAIPTGTLTGTMTMGGVIMARATTIPMGKPKGVAATATSVKSQTFYLSPSNHLVQTN